MAKTKQIYKNMDKVKIKRVKRNTKQVTAKEKILAGLGVGGAIMGASGAVSPKPTTQNIVSQKTNEQSSASSRIKAELDKIFGVQTALADTMTFTVSGGSLQKANNSFYDGNISLSGGITLSNGNTFTSGPVSASQGQIFVNDGSGAQDVTALLSAAGINAGDVYGALQAQAAPVQSAVTAQSASTTAYDPSLTGAEMNSIHDQLVGMIQAGQVPTINGGSVTAYMLGWGSGGGTQTVLGQTYVFDGANWQLQTAPAASSPSSPSSTTSTTYTYSEAQVSAMLNPSGASQITSLLNTPYSGALMDNAAMSSLSYYVQANPNLLPSTLQSGSLLAYMAGYAGGGVATSYTTALGYVSSNGNLVLQSASSSSPSSPSSTTSPASSPSSSTTAAGTTLTISNINSTQFDGSQSMISQLTAMQPQILQNLSSYTTVNPGTALAYILGLGDGSSNPNTGGPLASGDLVEASDNMSWYKAVSGGSGMEFQLYGVTESNYTAPTPANVNDVQYDGSIVTDTLLELHVKGQITSSEMSAYQQAGINPGSDLAYMLGLGNSTATPALNGTDGKTYNLGSDGKWHPAAAAAASSAVTMAASGYQVGDNWTVTLTNVPAGAPVLISGSRDGVSYDATPPIQTPVITPNSDGTSTYVYQGQFSASDLKDGTSASVWVEDWTVNGQSAGQLNFTVTPAASTAAASLSRLTQTYYQDYNSLLTDTNVYGQGQPAFFQNLTWSGPDSQTGSQGNGSYATFQTAQLFAQAFGGQVVMIPGTNEYANFASDSNLVHVNVPGQGNDYQYAVAFPGGVVVNAGDLTYDYWQGGSAEVQQQLNLIKSQQGTSTFMSSVPYYMNVDASGNPTGNPVAVPVVAQEFLQSGFNMPGSNTGASAAGSGVTAGATAGSGAGNGTTASGTTITRGTVTGAVYNSQTGIVTINGSGFGSGLAAGDIVLVTTPGGQQLSTTPTSVNDNQITILADALPAGTYSVSVMLGANPNNITNTVTFTVPAASGTTPGTTGPSAGANTGPATGANNKVYHATMSFADSRTGSSTLLTVGDSWSLNIGSAQPNTAVYVSGGLVGSSSFSSIPAQVGTTDANGSFSMTGQMQEGSEGSWQLNFYVGASQVGTRQDFTVVSAAAAGTGSGNSGGAGATGSTTGNTGNSGGAGGNVIVGVTPFFTTSSLPAASVGQAYSASVVATSNYSMTYSINSGSLPPGLAMANNGVISGVPTAAGSYTFGVRAVTSQGVSNAASYTVVVNSSSGAGAGVAGGGAVYTYSAGAQLAPANVTAWPAGLQMPAGYPASGGASSQSGAIDLSGRYADVNGTIYDKNTGLPFSTPQQLFQATGISSFNNVIFDMNWTPAGGAVSFKASTQTYTVKKGDTLFGISQKVYGNGGNWRKILSANPSCLSIPGNTKTLKIGAVLTIPQL